MSAKGNVNDSNEQSGPHRCPECGRTLCISDGRLMCVWRHCGDYGRPIEDENNDDGLQTG